MPIFTPTQRTKSIKIQEIGGELLVYDQKIHKAHCLTDMALTVWNLCDGKHSVEQIAGQIAQNSGNFPNEDEVWQVLTQFSDADLLEVSVEAYEARNASVKSRRRAIAKMGLATATPFFLSISVPPPAFAASSGHALLDTDLPSLA